MLRCLYCSHENSVGATHCSNCGNVLSTGTVARGLLANTSSFSDAGGNTGVPQTGRPAGSTFQPPSPQAGQVFGSAPEPTVRSSASQVKQTFGPPPEPTSYSSGVQAMQAPPPQAMQIPINTMGSAGKGISVRRAFAGYGIPLNHRSFLLPRKEVEAKNVLQRIAEILGKRNPSFQLRGANLRESGFQMEERHYLIMQRRVSTVFIYVAPAGDDLYISRSTSILCSISTWRIVILVMLIAAIFVPICILPAVLASASQGGAGGLAALGVAALISPLMILFAVISAGVLGWYLFRSIGYWLREKDFKVYLRSLFIKDFEMDDIMLLEHAADMTIRTAVEGLGLDASQITPPEEGYKQERHVRLL